ncbi:MAG TPA: TIGR03118 family protein [Bryobacteraceae bacterium]|nr:TIGR03118 family protein [Bryobacteraceae bacterium]
MINQLSRHFSASAVIAVSIIAATTGRADAQQNAYVVNPLVSDQAGKAPIVDSNLKNAWGVAFTPAASPFWIADNATGVSTLYDGAGNIQSLVVTIPCPPNPGQGSSCPQTAAPTGMVWSPTTMPATAFLVPGTKLPASFIWDTEDGTLSAWTGGLGNVTPPLPPNNAVLAVDNSRVPNGRLGAVYKGLAVGVNASGNNVFLFATNFRGGTIDVFAPNQDSNGVGLPFKSVSTHGGFSDPNIPPGFAPFGIQNINGDLFVTYALQNAAKHDDKAGPGNGFVDVFDTDGNLLRRFASQGALNSPWGVARASFAFGLFSGQILVGDFGDGRINVFDSNGNFLAQLGKPNGKALRIDGLWTLTLGGGKNSSSDTLYFTAGPNKETNGLFGTITPAFD